MKRAAVGGDSAATVADGGEGTSEQEGTGSAAQTAQEKLSQALLDASSAMEESQTALSEGDWAKYGEAQDKLDAAISKACTLSLKSKLRVMRGFTSIAPEASIATHNVQYKP